MRAKSRPLKVLLTFFTMNAVIVLGFASIAASQEASCDASWDRWERVFQQLRSGLQEFTALQQTPLERIVQGPLVAPNAGKTVARQISDGMQVKEDLLNSKRRACNSLIDQEAQLFQAVEGCMSDTRENRNKEARKLVKTRKSVLESAAVTLSEVREVEGRETNLPYSAAARGYQDNYGRGADAYWQRYQQMYRRWWGY